MNMGCSCLCGNQVRKWAMAKESRPGLKDCPQCPTSTSQAPSPKGPIASQNSGTSWSPDVQMHKPIGNILHASLTACTSSTWSCNSKSIWGSQSCSRIERRKSAEDSREHLKLQGIIHTIHLEVFNIWATEMAHSVSYFPHKHEDGNLESQDICGGIKLDTSSHA